MPIEASYLLAPPEAPPPRPQETPPSYGPDAYARMLKDLLPRGAAWLLESGSWLSRTLLAIADELARIDGRAEDLLREQDPRTAIETIADWERDVGLPDDLVPELPNTIGERQVAVVQRLLSRGGQTPAFFAEMAAALGYEGATVEEYPFAQLRVGFRAGDRAAGNAWAHAWRLNLPANGPVYERLDVEAIIRRAAPAHTTVVFSYT
jgi:uncharacterized protein YmfQ (DUF2313 family)